MAVPSSHYSILGIPRNADFITIREAYLSMARRHHPDRAKENESVSSRFTDVHLAWETLSDPDKRALYDAVLNSTRSEVCQRGGPSSQTRESTRAAAVWMAIRLAEMEKDDDGYIFNCRCGDCYELFESDITGEGSIFYIPCGGCSLKIRVDASEN